MLAGMTFGSSMLCSLRAVAQKQLLPALLELPIAIIKGHSREGLLGACPAFISLLQLPQAVQLGQSVVGIEVDFDLHRKTTALMSASAGC